MCSYSKEKDGYTAQNETVTGKIKADKVSEVVFINVKDAPETEESEKTPGTETPSTGTPGTETPSIETPSTENPSTETPSTETPGTETPGTETPEVPTPDTETPESPDTEAPTPTEEADCTITVTKQVLSLNDGHWLGLIGADFYVALFADEDLSERVSEAQKISFIDGSTAVESTSFSGLEPGTYYVAEVDASGEVISNGEFGGGYYAPDYTDGQVVTVADGETASFEFNNIFATLPGPQYYRDLGRPDGSDTETEPVTATEKEPETKTTETTKATETTKTTETSAPATSVQTGDETNAGQWMMLMFLAAICMMAVQLGERRRRSRK